MILAQSASALSVLGILLMSGRSFRRRTNSVRVRTSMRTQPSACRRRRRWSDGATKRLRTCDISSGWQQTTSYPLLTTACPLL